MTVVVNGLQRDLPAGAALADAVAVIATAVTGVAVALNGTVVPRSQWQSTGLCDADQVEILTAVQGG